MASASVARKSERALQAREHRSTNDHDEEPPYPLRRSCAATWRTIYSLALLTTLWFDATIRYVLLERCKSMSIIARNAFVGN